MVLRSCRDILVAIFDSCRHHRFGLGDSLPRTEAKMKKAELARQVAEDREKQL